MLDRLFFLPLKENETIEQRSESIDSYLVSVGYTWDDVLETINYKSEKN